MRFLLVWLPLLGLLPTLARAQAAPTSGFARTPSGIDYQLFRRDAAGRYAPRPLHPAGDSSAASREGRYLLAHLSYRTGRDSVLEDTRQKFHNLPVPVPLVAATGTGQPDEALALLLPGDSAVFRFNVDSLYRPQGRPVPGFLKRSGNVLVLQTIATQLLSRSAGLAAAQRLQQLALADQTRKLAAYAATQAPKDNANILAYLRKNKLAATVKKTPLGVWYVITKRGPGPLPKPGQLVSVLYRGTLLGGREFDSSAKNGGQPFTFGLGQGQVIPGWEEGIAVLPRGSKAVLLIPAALAYGEAGSGSVIPPNAILRFDVELVGIKNLPQAPGP